ncbi:class I adenylate-forming enzyme family protein [Saccharothrix coeruleofusca]|uniref:AMP-dependent synthetase and ligase n=1 Tax=Saccharothrix coeruleofusca TaxID=33919 RepID=A0A918AS83_9PSEU|nr:AMP-binding protein [Saccharothrix coeruleofusca]MBP2336697.1 acyl-CoA synthetase (AMP-forming)/AMP-acid ligase II [Saccharothrix coeruleofusca]GGP78671.1 AMP-dependent synthetase and ligase [Saccharothrix coeruleofusca]
MARLVHELLDEAVERRGAAPAFSGKGLELDYRQVRSLSLGVAAELVRCGLRRGDRVVVRTPNDPRLAALVFGASRVGVALAVIHEQVRGHALEHILDDCGPGLLVTADPEAGRTARERGIAVVSLEELTDRSGVETGERAGGVPPLAVDPVLLIYTSGTTALPKAVVSTHAQVVFAAEAIHSRLRYQPDDVVYCPLPLSFDYGLYQLFLGVLGGSHVVVGDAAEAGPSLVSNLARVRATVLPAVPPVAAALLRLLRRDPSRTAPLRLMTNTGAAVSRDVLRGLRALLPRLRVQLMFGLTECKRVSIMDPDEDLARPDAVGRPLPGTEVFTVDERGNRLPDGEPGELTVRGPHVMAGYWRRPELSAQRFPLVDGLFPELRSGDYGWLDEDGHLHFLGRRDDVYKQQGFRVSAVEVEAAARGLDGVDAAAVLPPAPERDHAVLVVAATVEPGQVLRLLAARLEDFKVPARCLVLDALPVNANGKTDKKALLALLRESTDA